MGRRIFIAINLLEDIKKRLADFYDNWPDLPVRWTKKDNLHITLVFLGFTRDEDLMEVITKTRSAVKKHSQFKIELNKICYGPKGMKSPKMIWAEGEKSKELAALQKDIELALTFNPASGFNNIIPPPGREVRAFSPHITLARINQMEWRRQEPDEVPEISEDIDISFEAISVEVMESELKRSGPVYNILESIDLED